MITSALAAQEDSRCLSLQFEIEQSRLRDFLQAAGLVAGAGEDDSTPLFLTRTTILLNVLSEIKLTLIRYTKNEECPSDPLKESTTPTVTSDLSDGYSFLSNKLLLNLQRAPEPIRIVRNFTWSIFQKSESEKVLQRLGRYNDFLHELLDAQQLRNLQIQQQENCMELVQMRNSLEDIGKLKEAAHASKNVHNQSSAWQHTLDEELENLAGFKSLYTSLLKDSSSRTGNTRIASSKIHLATEQQDHPRVVCRFDDDDDEREAWIEWHSRDIHDEECTTSISVIEELTVLLMAPKPDEFCIPACVGYAILQHGEEKARPALIFEKPAGVDPQFQPVSLLKVLQVRTKPTLTHRVALAHKVAQCLLYLHAVNWLHKALRSSNILFFPLPDTEVDIRSPYITGFDNSRRSRFDEATTQVPRMGRMEVYRHPDTQLDGPTLPYRKTFDIYSLGLILAEIALWEPIVSIMGIQETMDRSGKATSGVQGRWLASEPKLLDSLRAEVGEKYAGAVETCLQGRDAFAIETKDTETSADTAMIIQRGFNAKVVRPLAEIVV